ncbi:MAG: flagellar basal body P-ring formation chaperone FlgA [Pirellulales bacterium]
MHAIPRHTLATMLLLVVCSTAGAAEIRLRSDAQPGGPIVLLGDVAEVTAASTPERQRLEAIELFPAPPAGGRRTVRRREIADTLSLRGIDWAESQLVGSSVVEIHLPELRRAADNGPVTDTIQRRVERLVSNAIVEFLRRNVSERMPWEVKPQLADDVVAAIVDAGPRAELHVADETLVGSSHAGADTIDGEGRSSTLDRWVGPRQFTVELVSDSQHGMLDVPAVVSLPPRVVVVNRALPTGATLNVEDLSLVHVERPPTEAFFAVDQVVGSELTRPVAAGQVLDTAQVRAPLFVRRGDVVDVFSYAAGIQVKTLARVREDGARGDMVMVESVQNRRETFRARVTGVQRVEVFARGRNVAAPDTPVSTTAYQARLRTTRQPIAE